MNRTIALLSGRDVTERIFTPQHLERLAEFGDLTVNSKEGPPSPEHLAELVQGADIAITSWGCPQLYESVLRRAPDLKLIMHAAGTVKGIVTPEVMRRGIRVSSANGALAKGVAETALGLTIVSLKNIWQLSRDTREGEWGKNRDRVRELYGVTIGVVGAGKAGRCYIELLRHFEVDILVCDPTLTDSQVRQLGAVKVELERLLRESDVVSLHVPSIPATRNMLNAERLRLMKDDAVLINTARGSVIDEDALVAELRKGRLWACLDVTDPEPPAANHPFRMLPNVTLIPHIAGAVNNGLHRIAEYVLREIASFIEERPLDGEVDLAKLDVLA